MESLPALRILQQNVNKSNTAQLDLLQTINDLVEVENKLGTIGHKQSTGTIES